MATKQRTRAKKSQSRLTLQKPNGQLGPGQQRLALGMQGLAKRNAIVRKTSIVIAVRSDLLARLVAHAQIRRKIQLKKINVIGILFVFTLRRLPGQRRSAGSPRARETAGGTAIALES